MPKISELTAGTTVDGTEKIPAVQNGVTVYLTQAQLAALASVQDANFTLTDDVDTTKRARFQLSGIATATTRTYTFPDVTDTLVTLSATQTLTGKTLTDPVISRVYGGTAAGSSVTVQSTSNGSPSGDSTNVYGSTVTIGNAINAPSIINLNGASGGGVTVNIASPGNGLNALNVYNGAGSKQIWIPGGGNTTVTFPAATDTLVGKATTDTLTNKTYDTAGTGNSFSINGLAATANTGTGSVVRSISPTFTGTVNTAAISAAAQVTVSYASPVFSIVDSGTSYSFFQIQNAGGTNQMRVGAEQSAGAALFPGSAGLAGVIGMTVNQPLQIFTNNALRATVQAGGGVSIGTATDPGVGALIVNGAISTSTGVFSTGYVLSSSSSSGVGYSTGAGGTVTQLTSKSTGATLSKVSGAITMNNAALASATIVSFVLTNTAIAVTDVLVLNHISGGTIGAYTLNAQCAAGSATISVRNNTAGSLSDAIVIQFAVIKAVNA